MWRGILGSGGGQGQGLVTGRGRDVQKDRGCEGKEHAADLMAVHCELARKKSDAGQPAVVEDEHGGDDESVINQLMNDKEPDV